MDFDVKKVGFGIGSRSNQTATFWIPVHNADFNGILNSYISVLKAPVVLDLQLQSQFSKLCR